MYIEHSESEIQIYNDVVLSVNYYYTVLGCVVLMIMINQTLNKILYLKQTIIPQCVYSFIIYDIRRIFSLSSFLSFN